MNTTSTHGPYLEGAFLQLAFAIKLWHYTEEGHLEKSIFEIDLTIEDPGQRVVLVSNQFNTSDDLCHAAANNISICFGVAATTLSKCIEEKRGKQWPPRLSTVEDKIAGLSYMIRCCFAHGPAVPVWEMNPRFRVKYEIYNLSVDLTHRNRTRFDYSHIGGYETLWKLKAWAEDLGLVASK